MSCHESLMDRKEIVFCTTKLTKILMTIRNGNIAPITNYLPKKITTVVSL